MFAEIPATKKQNLLLAEIDELLRRTFGTSEEEKTLQRTLEGYTPLFRGRLNVIASENGKPKGIEPMYRISIADATMKFLERIRVSVPEGAFDEVSARARMLAEEEDIGIYGDTKGGEAVWAMGCVAEKKDPGFPARTAVLDGCQHLGCEYPIK
jgi:hypothetical protein